MHSSQLRLGPRQAVSPGRASRGPAGHAARQSSRGLRGRPYSPRYMARSLKNLLCAARIERDLYAFETIYNGYNMHFFQVFIPYILSNSSAKQYESGCRRAGERNLSSLVATLPLLLIFFTTLKRSRSMLAASAHRYLVATRAVL